MKASVSKEEHVWRWRVLAAGLILLASLGRLLYLLHYCPLDLAPDEAHYWDWSRRLDWSYYSKGPLVAYLIHISCAFLGPWSLEQFGNEMVAVRLPAVLCGGLLLASLYVLTAQVLGREKPALVVVAAALTFPVLNAGACLMTIDAPFACCWGWALVCGFQALFRASWWGWPLAGVLIGLGTLAKYTMLLWPACLVLFLLTTPGFRQHLFRPGFWFMLLLAAVLSLPILIWNIENKWIGLRHLLGLAGFQKEAAKIHWLGPLVFLGGQFLLLLGYWFTVWLEAIFSRAPWRSSRPQERFLWWLSAPVFSFFLLFSLKNGGGEWNWPVTAYLSGMVLALGWLVEHLAQKSWAYRFLTGSCMVLMGLLGLAITLAVHDSGPLRPLVADVSARVGIDPPLPVRRWDPTCRLRGWRTLAAAVDEVRSRLKKAGLEPVLAAERWTIAGELGFYCQGHPHVYALGLVLGDRYSQYDLWRPNPVTDGLLYNARTFIVVGATELPLENAFHRLEVRQIVTHVEGGQTIARWTIMVGHGFRGFPSRSPRPATY